MKPERLSEIQKLIEDITPGEWKVDAHEYGWCIVDSHDKNVVGEHDDGRVAIGWEDAQFVAVAPKIVRELLAEIEAQQKAIKWLSLKADLDQMKTEDADLLMKGGKPWETKDVREYDFLKTNPELSTIHSFPDEEPEATCTRCGLKRSSESYTEVRDSKDVVRSSWHTYVYQKPGSPVLYGSFSDIPCIPKTEPQE